MRVLASVLCFGAVLMAASVRAAESQALLKPFQAVEVHAPGHFGNSYEVMGLLLRQKGARELRNQCETMKSMKQGNGSKSPP